MIKGVKIVAEKMLVVSPKEPLTYCWEKYGFEVHIPAGAFSESEPMTLCIQAGLSGDYQLPDDGVLVSGVYSLSLNPPVEKFRKKVSLAIQHCASGDDSTLSFVAADSTQDKPPYIFEQLKGGNFSDSGDHGTIEVAHFTLYALSAEDSLDYTIRTYYVPVKDVPNAYVAHIAVTQNTPIVIEVRLYFSPPSAYYYVHIHRRSKKCFVLEMLKKALQYRWYGFLMGKNI